LAVRRLETTQRILYKASDDKSREKLKGYIHDTYGACICASGKKYKFCCRPISDYISLALEVSHYGLHGKALDYIVSAKEIVGETAELVYYEAMISEMAGKESISSLLEKCLAINPNHPRTHQCFGSYYKNSLQYERSIEAYQKAIAHYPPSNHYYLTSAWTELGTVYFTSGDYDKAKEAWEKALSYNPRDRACKECLSLLS